ncbi:hypothetical protein MNBD_BACTEROID05-257 [hydrothermal vent metagenome]|uniref:ATPase n=1 Tax=hydrothermal vent metagenome TaxID=652676 RepID=A0A3B0TA48_9ZZZZ
MIYTKRTLESILKESSAQFPALIVTGPRQSGKTTLLKHLFGNTHNYVSLDNPDIRLIAINEPELFLENYKPPVIIDEAQYAPGLFPYLKILIDQKRSRNGQFLLTGSQSFPLMAGVSESLAGRIAVFTLLSFSLKEQIKKKLLTYDQIRKLSLRGGYPDLAVHKNKNSRIWFNSYLQTYLERDVRQLRQIGDLNDFQRFLELLASINGCVLNKSTLANDLGVSVNTIKAWISVLEASHQIVLIKPFYKNKGKRITKSPKIYFLDTGFLCFLNGWSSKEQIFKGPLAGQFFESIVLNEILRSFYHEGELPRVYWWRTSHGEEVDFIVERDGKLLPIEVKMTSRIHKGLAKNLDSFCRLFHDDINQGILVNLSNKKIKITDKIISMPFQYFVT